MQGDTSTKLRLSVVAVLLLVSLFFVRLSGLPWHFALVVSPNGGEVFETDKPITIRWTPGGSGIRQIDIVPVSGASPLTVYTPAPFGYPMGDNSGSFTFQWFLPPDSYYAKIYYANSNDFDISDAPFRVTTGGVASPFPSPQPQTLLWPSNIRVEGIGDVSAHIKWETNLPAISTVEYKAITPDRPDGFSTGVTSQFITVHDTALTYLAPNTTYYYYLRLWDMARNEIRTETLSFTTRISVPVTPSRSPSVLPQATRTPLPPVKTPKVTPRPSVSLQAPSPISSPTSSAGVEAQTPSPLPVEIKKIPEAPVVQQRGIIGSVWYRIMRAFGVLF